MLKESVKNKFKFYLDNMLGSGSNALILWLGLISFAFVLFVSSVTWIVGISDHEEFGDLLWDFTMRAITPWEIEASMGSLPYLLVMLLVTLFGIFVLSILISFLSAIIDARVQAVGQGLQPFPFSNHTIIFGWSSRVPAIVEELVLANESEESPRIVIVANQDHEVLRTLVSQHIGPTKNTQLFWRSKKLDSSGTFDNVNVLGASKIIVLGDDQGSTTALDRIKTTISLYNYLDNAQGLVPNVLVEAEDSDEVASLSQGSKGRVTPVVVSDLPARLIIETVFQANLPSVYEELLSFEGNEFYITDTASVLGVSGVRFADLQTYANACIVIGIMSADDTPRLNPGNGDVICEDDRLIVIAEDDSLIRFDKSSSPVVSSTNSEFSVMGSDLQDGSNKLDVYILGVSGSADELVEGLLASERVNVTLIANDPSSVHPFIVEQVDRGAIQIIEGDMSDGNLIAKQDLGSADAIIVTNYDKDVPDNSDLKIIRALLQLNSLLDTRSGPHVIAELNSSDSRDMIAELYDLDFIVSDKIGSKIFAQYVENPHLIKVIDGLVCSREHRITIKELAITGIEEIRFCDLQNALKDSGGVLIGIRFGGESGYTTSLNPSPVTSFSVGQFGLQGIFVE